MVLANNRVAGINGDPKESNVNTVANGAFELFDLNQEIDRFPPGDSAAGRRAETLIKTDRLRVVLVTMEPGVTLAEHAAPGPVTIHVLFGRFTVTGNDHQQEVGPGGLVVFGAHDRHSVQALDAGAFLLTISWPSSVTGDPVI